MAPSHGVRFASCTPAILFSATHERVGGVVGQAAPFSMVNAGADDPSAPETAPGSRVERAGWHFLNGSGWATRLDRSFRPGDLPD
jgi:hypothetical protein